MKSLNSAPRKQFQRSKFSFMEMTIVQWATILSPIIAVLLAWWTCRSGARDTAKLIQCAKRLMLINLRIKILELSKEAKEEHVQFSSLLKQSKELSKLFHSQYSDLSDDLLKLQEQKEKDIDNEKDINIDRRMIIGETMTSLIDLIKDVEKL